MGLPSRRLQSSVGSKEGTMPPRQGTPASEPPVFSSLFNKQNSVDMAPRNFESDSHLAPSALSACTPYSYSASAPSAPAGSRLSACPPAQASILSASAPDAASSLAASQATASDFFSWRPR